MVYFTRDIDMPTDLYPGENEHLIFEYHSTRDLRIRDLIVEKNLSLVHWVIQRTYGSYENDLQDAVQYGVQGLITAIEKFKFSAGTCFSTYAPWWIKQTVTREYFEKKSLIRQPSYRLDAISKLRQLENAYAQYLGIEAENDKVLAEFVGCSEELISCIRHIAFLNEPLSYDVPIHNDEDFQFIDVMASTNRYGDPEDIIIERGACPEATEAMHAVLASVQPHHREIFYEWMNDGLSIKESAAIHNCTGENIRRIRILILNKIQKKLGLPLTKSAKLPTDGAPRCGPNSVKGIASFAGLVDAKLEELQLELPNIFFSRRKKRTKKTDKPKANSTA